nr:MAG TPA: hypothetical protein [Caudoviricetes sp.]
MLDSRGRILKGAEFNLAKSVAMYYLDCEVLEII